MDTIQDREDLIQTFLHIHYPNIDDKPYYDVDFEKNILNLYDPIYKIKTEKNSIFELNKIFTNENDNKYIYEETCSNTIKDCLNGQSIVFISYGITVSDKLKFIIGDVNDSYSNLNHRGIFPILLDKLISSLNNSKYSKYNYSINLSYMCFYDQKIIDLSNLLGKDFSSFTEENILKFGVELDKKIGGVSNIKKVPTENCNDVLFFINKLFSLLIKLEEDSFYNLYSRSHFVFMIYIINNDGKIISRLSFIILNGSEYLNSRNRYLITNKQMIKEEQQKYIVENSKYSHESQYIYDSIINSLKNNLYINESNDDMMKKRDSIAHHSSVGVDLDEIEKNNLSKLTRALFSIFSRKVTNIKFRIIGTILPNVGYYEVVKDTLMFLFRCHKIMVSRNEKRKHSSLNNSNSNVSPKNNNNVLKDDTIFELENKIKMQAMKIEDMGKILEKKQKKITIIEKNYKKQIEVLKNNFGFKGDVNILLDGNENTKEFFEAKKIKEACENSSLNKKTINDLEQKLKNANQEIQKLKNLLIIKEDDKTMLQCYHGINDEKIKKKLEEKNRNNLNIQIETYEKELLKKEKIINELKKELDNKNQILMSIPTKIKNHINSKILNDNLSPNNDKNNISSSFIGQNKYKNNSKNVNNTKNEKNKNGNNIEQNSDNTERPLLITPKEKVYRVKIADVINSNKKEIELVTKKYESLLTQNQEIIKNDNYQINKMQTQNKYEISMFEEELRKLNSILTHIFHSYHKIFAPILNDKCSLVSLKNRYQEFEKIINKAENEVNGFNFPFLYESYNKKGIPENITKYLKINLSEEKNSKYPKQKNVDYIDFMKNNSLSLDDCLPPTIEQIYNFIEKKEDILTAKKDRLERLSKEKILENYSNTVDIIHQIREYFKNYISYQKQNQVHDNTVELQNKINDYQNEIKKLKKCLEKETGVNTKNNVIIDSQNRIIEQLKKENSFRKNLATSKNTFDYSTISTNILRKNSDKLPVTSIKNKYIQTLYNNTFSKLNKSSTKKNNRNDTDNNSSVNYQPTNGTSGLISFMKNSTPNIDFLGYKKSKRPLTSKNKRKFITDDI